jgi:hypothetical protein
MDTSSPSMRELARRLVASSRIVSVPPAQDATLVNESLRDSLARFAGTDGFAALLRRALALAGVELPTLQATNVGADGRIEGIEQLLAHLGTTQEEAAVAITAHMLDLLVTLIGETLTRRLVRQACPEASPEE